MRTGWLRALVAALETLAAGAALVALGGTPALAGGAGTGAEEEGVEQEEERTSEPLDALVVTATRSERSVFDTPYSAEVIGQELIGERSYRTTPQVLRDTPGVMVQETAHGHGSPYIRGFTGYQDLFLIDGIRLNNSVFRSGPNQYWNTVDPFSIDRLELVKGPSSVLYGSDALGGTVNVLTRSPYAWDSASGFAGRAIYRVASAEESHQLRGEVSAVIGDSTGILIGGTTRQFGELQGGRDAGSLPYTGYDEWDADLKVEHYLSEDARLVLAHQVVRQDDVPRTHRTMFAVPFEGSSVGSDLRRQFDQERQLTYLQLHTTNGDGFFQESTTSLSFHRQEEERDRVRSSMAREKQGFDVGTIGFSGHLASETAAGRFTYGLEYYHDSVDSFLNKFASQTAADDIQGPVADDATYDLLGLFVQDEIEVNERLEVILGARFNHAEAEANEVRDPVTDTQTAIEDDWSAVVGSARFLYELEPERWNLFGGISQGFRAPNLSDLTRFDSARTNEFEVPAPDLDPEYTTNYELGLKRKGGTTSAQATVFYTDIDDAIVRVPTGNTNGSGEFEVTKDNVGDGWVAGVELAGAWRFDPRWTLFGNATWMEGRLDAYPTSAPTVERDYITRLMPPTAQLGLRWEEEGGRTWVELLAQYADDADKLSASDESDDSRIPPGGTPDYLVVGVRAGRRVCAGATVLLGVENVTDEDYRVHGSGQNMPGTNFLFVLDMTF